MTPGKLLGGIAEVAKQTKEARTKRAAVAELRACHVEALAQKAIQGDFPKRPEIGNAASIEVVRKYLNGYIQSVMEHPDPFAPVGPLINLLQKAGRLG